MKNDLVRKRVVCALVENVGEWRKVSDLAAKARMSSQRFSSWIRVLEKLGYVKRDHYYKTQNGISHYVPSVLCVEADEGVLVKALLPRYEIFLSGDSERFEDVGSDGSWFGCASRLMGE